MHECVYLGSDRWGEWFGQLPGWDSARPGRVVVPRHPNVTLVPPSGDYAFTRNAAPHHTRIYIDIAWDVRFDGGEPTGIDMDLDVVDREGRGVYIDDQDEWDEHRVAYGYPLDIVAAARGARRRPRAAGEGAGGALRRRDRGCLARAPRGARPRDGATRRAGRRGA